MTFDFDTVIDRAPSDSRKWRKYAGRDILPLWVADMDFAAPPAVLAALHRRVDHGVFGYAGPLPSLTEATVAYCAARYGWKIEPSWIVWLPGLVTALNLAARSMGAAGDAVLTATPIYPPFMSAPRNQGLETIMVPLAVRADGRHEFDWPAMERAVTPRTKVFFLCSPHNPVGRVFTRPELEQVAAFCAKHDLVLVSDDIHCDLILDDLPHLPIATLSAETAARSITLLAPSKTYNIAGLACSLAIIPDSRRRQQFVSAMAGIVPEMSPLGYAACEAAFREGEPWRQALLAYLRGNRDFLAAFLREHLPMITMTPCQATYLAWLDVSALKLTDAGAFFEQHGVGLADGAQYGAPAGHFVRLNFGCTRATLTTALQRMQRAVAAR
ncbi:Cystathionine beta-lyase PatB [Lacunisphaera limnophila]|uniref:cysteine-S-conjugate beta-lyase n=1 Tax=Lacunisphaera limnophila TaxID=1838286 RepID=A0A1D8AU77_9BACT|nr:PatB family C-S lyase [Lacunisphaera limnophila]AOS44443.1 Cystathionine beta-lyase PatB [Lacunisphaera limnophila]